MSTDGPDESTSLNDEELTTRLLPEAGSDAQVFGSYRLRAALGERLTDAKRSCDTKENHEQSVNCSQ